MAQMHGSAVDLEDILPVLPGHAILIWILGTVQAEDRAEHTELHPTRVEFWFFDAEEVTADIVAPPTEAHVRRRGGERGLEGERFPRDDAVTGEADRVAMVAQSAPAREDEGALLAFATEIIKMQMVQPP